MDSYHHHELQIELHPRQLRVEWHVQRAAWLLFTGLLVLVLLGLFGRGGPLSHVTAAADAATLRIEYERFLRKHSPAALEVDLSATGDSAQLRLSSSWLQGVRIERIVPEPARTLSGQDALIFEFPAEAGAEVAVLIEFHPDVLGRLRGRVEANGARLDLSHFVYP